LIIQNLTVQLAATIISIAQHPAETFAELAAKLKVFEMCDQNRLGRSRLLLLSRAMFLDFTSKNPVGFAKNNRADFAPLEFSVFPVT
jgi:hypothetical protein